MHTHSELVIDTPSYHHIQKHALPLLEEAVARLGREYTGEDRPLFLLIVMHINNNMMLSQLHESGELSLLIQVMKLWKDINFIKTTLAKLSSQLCDTSTRQTKRDFFLDFAKSNALLDMDRDGNVTIEWPDAGEIKKITVPASIPFAVNILEPAAYLSLASAGLIPAEWDWHNYGHGRYAHWIQLYILAQGIAESRIVSPLLHQADSPLKALLKIITSTKLLRSNLKESSTWDLLMDNYFFYTHDLLAKMSHLLKASSDEDIHLRLVNVGIPELIELFNANDNLLHEFHGKINAIMLRHFPELAAKIIVSPVKHDFREGVDWNDFLTPPDLKLEIARAISTYNDQWCAPRPAVSSRSFFCISKATEKEAEVNSSLKRLGNFYQNDLVLFKSSAPQGESMTTKVYVGKNTYEDEVVTGEPIKNETPYPCYKRAMS